MKYLLTIISLLIFSITYAQDKQGIRFDFLGGLGKFKLKTNDALNGDFDHDLSGGSFSISYNRTNEKQLYFGGGYQRVAVRSDGWQNSSSQIPGYWTYYVSSYGYFDAQIAVYDFVTTFLYGFIGYEISLSDEWLFQPNLKLGSKTATADWKTYIDWRDYSDTTTTYSESTSGFGLEIDLPFMYSFGETFSLGGNICLCSTQATFSQGTYDYEFTSSRVINLILDWRI